MKPVKSICMLLAVVLLSFAFGHPYHVNVIEIRHNSADSTWQMTVRVFTNEWEGVLRKVGSAKIDLKNEVDSLHNNFLLQQYLVNHLAIDSDSALLNWNWIGFENKQDETWCYLESKGHFSGEIKVKVDILYEHGHEQQTIVHLYANGKRFSRRVMSPEKVLVVKEG